VDSIATTRPTNNIIFANIEAAKELSRVSDNVAKTLEQTSGCALNPD